MFNRLTKGNARQGGPRFKINSNQSRFIRYIQETYNSAFQDFPRTIVRNDVCDDKGNEDLLKYWKRRNFILPKITQEDDDAYREILSTKDNGDAEEQVISISREEPIENFEIFPKL